MGWESILFVSEPRVLATFFPGWKPPLADFTTTTLRNPFTGEDMTIVSDAATYDDDHVDCASRCDWGRFRKVAPASLAQELTVPLLETLADLLEVETPALRRALSEPPGSETVVLQLTPAFVEALASLSPDEHESLGMEIRPDLGESEAAAMVAELAALAQKASASSSKLYFIEER